MRVLIGWVLTLFVLFTAVFLAAGALGVLGEAATADWLRSLSTNGRSAGIIAVAIAILLASDLFLPVPSSVVMLLSGYFLGITAGTLVSFAGAMTSALAGFWLCRRFGRRGFESAIGRAETNRVEALFDRYGDWTILLSRPVPMLTEIVSCVSGLSRMSSRRFTALSGAATLPLCALYAWAGRSVESGAPAWLMLAAIAVPAAGFAVVKEKAPH